MRLANVPILCYFAVHDFWNEFGVIVIFAVGALIAILRRNRLANVLPLLVHACSEKCIQSLPQPAFGYVQEPHFGALDLKQPPPR